jgi:3,4-dihydroxy 2-butanone 4-phosphate synthase/GTP cyclohydrolase II
MTKSQNCVCSVQVALDELRAGRALVIIDEERADSEGDLVAAADTASLDTLRFMVSTGGGLMCLAQPQAQLQNIKLPETMTKEFTLGASFNYEKKKATFSGGQDNRGNYARLGSQHYDERHPVVPLCTRRHGVLARRGHAESIVDLARLAGLSPSGFLCKITKPGHSLPARSAFTDWAEKYDLKILTVSELLKYRLSKENHVRRTTEVETALALNI